MSLPEGYSPIALATVQGVEVLPGRSSVMIRARLEPRGTSVKLRLWQPYVGGSMGFTALPREGDEVVAVFPSDDINAGVCFWGLYNGVDEVPQGTADDMILLEGRPGDNLKVHIRGDVDVTIDGNKVERVRGDERHEVGGDETEEIGEDWKKEVAGETKVITGGKTVIESGVAGGGPLQAEELLQLLSRAGLLLHSLGIMNEGANLGRVTHVGMPPAATPQDPHLGWKIFVVGATEMTSGPVVILVPNPIGPAVTIPIGDVMVTAGVVYAKGFVELD